MRASKPQFSCFRSYFLGIFRSLHNSRGHGTITADVLIHTVAINKEA